MIFDFLIAVSGVMLFSGMIGLQGWSGDMLNVYGASGEYGENKVDQKYCWRLSNDDKRRGLLNANGQQLTVPQVYELMSGVACTGVPQHGIVQ